MIRTRIAALVAVAGTLLIGACGTTENGSTQAQADSDAAGPVTVTDGRGQRVELDAPAERVVGLEWGEVEMLVSLGVMPVGVADIDGYGTWVTAAELDASVQDVGTRNEPSVDSIVALEPDLVVMEAERSSPLVTQLEEYVPVLVTTGSDASDNLARMRDDVMMIATAVGKTDEATAVLADFDAAIVDAREKIANAGATGEQFAIADGWIEGSTVSIRMFGEGALVSQIATELGLENAWTGEVDDVWGLGQTDVEGLTILAGQDVHLLYNASDGTDVFADGLAGNPIWESLPFVQQGRLYKLPDGIWTFGGPLSGQQYIDQLVTVYTG